jgi:hypothetical protein
VEAERVLAGDVAVVRRDVLEQAHPTRERLAEPLFLRRQDAVDVGAVRFELRVRLAHLLDHDVAEAIEVRRLESDTLSLLDGAADDPAHHVAAALVRRRHAVRREERHPTAVVGEDPMRLRRLRRVAVRNAALLRDPAHDRLVAVGLVHRDDALEDGGRPLEPHTRVHVLLRERRQLPVGVELELHEDEVPELEEPLARAPGRAFGPAAADLLAAVVVHLGVRAAGPGAADRPEVLGRRQEDEPLGRLADLQPVVVRDLVLAEPKLGIAGEDADPEPCRIDLQVLEDEVPRELDRALLEVLAEREVAEHLEEGEVVAVEPDLVDVVRAEALLEGRQDRRGRLLAPEEERHQRLHARRREERRPVVRPRSQRPGRPERVALRLEVGAKTRPQLG